MPKHLLLASLFIWKTGVCLCDLALVWEHPLPHSVGEGLEGALLPGAAGGGQAATSSEGPTQHRCRHRHTWGH